MVKQNDTAIRRYKIVAIVLLSTSHFLSSRISNSQAFAGELKPVIDQPELYEKRVQPMVAKYCLACHQGDSPKSGVRLDLFPTLDTAIKDSSTWRRVLQMLRDRSMPPPGSPKPSEDDFRSSVQWLQDAIDKIDASAQGLTGHVTIRRLNRAEYTNTIRDLLGIKFDAAAIFPSDDVGYGFDNIGDVLTLPPLLMDKYLTAAEQISKQAIAINDPKAEASIRPEEYQRLFVVRPDNSTSEKEASRQIIRHFALRAYRRPASDKEVERIARLVDSARNHGDSFEAGVQLAVKAILVSPKFLFRMEVNQRGDDDNKTSLVGEYYLASRLSYFLWSTMPDEKLFKQASRTTLRKNLSAEVKRMLVDAKTQAFVQNFAGQWLQLRKLERTVPNHDEFPSFSDDLRRDMRTETEMFFRAILQEDRSIFDFIDADFTFVNARLARHYGLTGINGNSFQRVSLKSSDFGAAAAMRGGIITQASMLTVTSNPTRTSPVKRGKWIMENVLGTPPADPPPNVPLLEDDAQASATASLRERMEIHRKNSVCASCHNAMDPLGFALENFDGIGAWRTRDGKFPIDPEGQLPSGARFKGPGELKELIKNGGKDKFARCLTEKMLTYALGRGLESSDRPTVDTILRSLANSDYRFSALIFAIVESDPFQKRIGRKQTTI